MTRYLLALVLLAAAVSAHAMTPARQGANGSGGTCPEAEVEAVATAQGDEATAPAAPDAAKATPPAQVKGGGGGMARPKSGARWHSFLPGMFK